METPNKTSTSAYKDLQNDPYYFSHFINMGRHNAYLIIHYIYKCVYKEELNLIESNLYQFSSKVKANSKKNPDELTKVIRLLLLHFPFLAYYDNAEREKRDERVVGRSNDGNWNKKVKERPYLSDKNTVSSNSEKASEKATSESHICLERLSQFLIVLNNLRNETSHYKHPKKSTLLPDFQKMYQSGIKEAQRRMNYEDKDIQHLFKDPHYKLIETQKQTETVGLTKFNGQKKVNRQPQVNGQTGTDKLAKVDKLTGFDKLTEVDELQDLDELTEIGIYYFICLFLDKKNGYLLLSRIRGFKDRNRTSEKYKSATLEAFTQFHCLVPNPKLESSNIAMDMLNELNRCPRQLYQVLSQDDKEKFVATDTEKEEDSDEVPEPIMKRSEDRFPYFALRYFEEMSRLGLSGTLDQITFQLFLGRKHDQEPHTKILNGTQRTHSLLKNMHVFGKLPFYQKEEAYQFYEGNEEVEFYAPAYRIVGNRIGLVLKDIHPHYTIPKSDGNYKNGNCKNGNCKNENCPDAILSTHELSALFFYNFLHKKGWIDTPTHQFIRDYLDRFRRFINDLQSGKIEPVNENQSIKKSKRHDDRELAKISQRSNQLQKLLDQYGLKVSWLPDACREYLLNYQVPSHKWMVKDKFVSMKKDAERKLKRLTSFKEKCTERGHGHSEEIKTISLKNKQIRIGELAQELARDLVFLTPPQTAQNSDAKKKINNLEFDILQKMLAYFPSYKDELKPFLEILKEKDNRWKHPFLGKIVTRKYSSCSSLTDLYKAYYEQKIDWIDTEILKRSTNRDRKTTVSLRREAEEIASQYEYILKLDRKTKPATEKIYSEEAVYLPTGLFEESIVRAIKQHSTELGIDIKSGSNVAGCLMAYCNNVKQPMYSLPRYYNAKELGYKDAVLRDEIKEKISEFFSKQSKKNVRMTPTDKKVLHEKENEMKNLAKRIKENEAEILRQQNNDRALFLMVNDLLPASLKGDPTRPGDEITELGRLGFDQQHNMLDREYEMCETIYGRKVTAVLPIKRYGEFRRFLKDRRLENLLKYYPEGAEIRLGAMRSGCTQQKGEKFKDSNLSEEIEIYDMERDKLLKLIYDFEKLLIDHYADEITKTKDQYYNHTNCLIAAQKLGINIDPELLLEEEEMENEIKVADQNRDQNRDKDGNKNDVRPFEEKPNSCSEGNDKGYLCYENREKESVSPENDSKQVANQSNGKKGNNCNLGELRRKLIHNEIPYEPWIEKEINKRKDEPMITKRIVCLVSDIYSQLVESLQAMVDQNEGKQW